jgi:hypothetical protein
LYKVNRMGPRTDPCGTPKGRRTATEFMPYIETDWQQKER